jgi:hypothetical protein
MNMDNETEIEKEYGTVSKETHTDTLEFKNKLTDL